MSLCSPGYHKIYNVRRGIYYYSQNSSRFLFDKLQKNKTMPQFLNCELFEAYSAVMLNRCWHPCKNQGVAKLIDLSDLFAVSSIQNQILAEINLLIFKRITPRDFIGLKYRSLASRVVVLCCSMYSHGFESPPKLVDTWSASVWIKKAWLPCWPLE